MKIRDVLSFIAFTTMIALAVGYIGSLGIRIGPPSNRTNVSMTVPDANGLVVGSNILLRGVPVGKVSDITSSVDQATIDFYIDGRYRVPVDSDVRLDNLSALGESYIGLMPRTQDGPMLQDGARIATDKVVAPPSISELTTSVVRVVNQLDPDALKRIINEVDTALPDPNTVLPNISHASELLNNTVADMHGQGRALLDNFQTLLRNADWLGPVLADLAPSVRATGENLQHTLFSTFKVIYAGAPQTLNNTMAFLDRIVRFLDNNAGDLKVLGENFGPHVKTIAGALMNLDPSQILSNFLAQVPQDGAITLHVAIPGN
jgi:phospholipid/cholesterol/gamma-HCH transport system substrate-binding protein